MFINLYEEIIASKPDDFSRRAAACALRLCRGNRKADVDAVYAAAMLSRLNDEDIAEMLKRNEWYDDRIKKVLDCLHCLDGFLYPPEYPADSGDESDSSGSREPNRDDGETQGTSQAHFSLEAKILCDAFCIADSGIISAAEKLGGFTDILPKKDDKKARALTKRGGAAIAEAKKSADEWLRALGAEIDGLEAEHRRFYKERVFEAPLHHRLGLIRPGAGFKMDGYFVWCASVIKHKNKYHMLASRWKSGLSFPEGYMVGSEIVHAVSDDPLGPFSFTNRVIAQRPRGSWDSQMAHNPRIIRIRDLKGELFLLYYIGTPYNDANMRRIGAASARAPEGPWTRPDKPIELGLGGCFCPSPMQDDDGSILMAFGHGDFRIGIARARRWDGEYELLSNDILPGVEAEDPFLYKYGGRYYMIVSDTEGKLLAEFNYKTNAAVSGTHRDAGARQSAGARKGAMLVSDDGIDWKLDEYPKVYGNTLMYSDMSVGRAELKMHPFLLCESGRPKVLYTAVLKDGGTASISQPINDIPLPEYQEKRR
ncbi:MAG TPA: family 43 glycosylhydrolase [Clostridiales bacterium]|jgi:hypothetical protein|nr:family 43 glycosylhydrolase [Clostridiales bacterium]